jgi:hypothetical protein
LRLKAVWRQNSFRIGWGKERTSDFLLFIYLFIYLKKLALLAHLAIDGVGIIAGSLTAGLNRALIQKLIQITCCTKKNCILFWS